MNFLTIDDLSLDGKTVFLRVDLNTPIDPKSGELLELNRISEASVSVRDLANCKLVIGSHQGRPGRYDYIPLDKHAIALSNVLKRPVQYIEDIVGPAAQKAIDSLSPGDILLLDNLRFMTEENMEFSAEQASKTIMVQRLYRHFEGCVLDAFPTGHRAHPSIVGFSHLLPTGSGRLVAKELKALNRILTVVKGPFVTVLGGAKVSDRLGAIDTLIANRRADKVLLSGVIANVFLKASGKLKGSISAEEEKFVPKARTLMDEYSETFQLPLDVVVERNGETAEIKMEDLQPDEKIYDIGPETIDYFSRIIRSSGTIFMSGPPGFFEDPRFGKGTEKLLRAMSSSLGTTIVSGGHLSAALERFGIKEWIDHVSTAGGALVLYLAGKRLPLMEALENAAERMKK